MKKGLILSFVFYSVLAWTVQCAPPEGVSDEKATSERIGATTSSRYAASEVVPETNTTVRVRQHPKTGKPYVSIVPADAPDSRYPFPSNTNVGEIHEFPLRSRPDYRMLDYKIKSGQIPYNGPVSDRAKVYVLAAALVTTGALGAVAIPAGTGVAGAGSGVGAALLGGGAAVSTGAAAKIAIQSQPDPKRDPFTHKAEARFVDVQKEKK